MRDRTRACDVWRRGRGANVVCVCVSIRAYLGQSSKLRVIVWVSVLMPHTLVPTARLSPAFPCPHHPLHIQDKGPVR